MRRNIPIVLALIMGLVMLTTYYFPWMDGIYQLVLTWDPVIAGFAFFLGIISFFMSHWYKVKRRAPNWGYNLSALLAFVIMTAVGLLKIGNIEGTAEESPFAWSFMNILVPMEATMFALLAFYIASASFRAFRARNVEATLLLLSAMLIMIGRVPLGEWVWAGFSDVQQWILEFPNTAAKRAIMIGVGLGMASTSLKLMLGIERSYLGKGS